MDYPNSFLEHAVKTPSQYTEGYRELCQLLLDARKRIEDLERQLDRYPAITFESKTERDAAARLITAAREYTASRNDG